MWRYKTGWNRVKKPPSTRKDLLLHNPFPCLVIASSNLAGLCRSWAQHRKIPRGIAVLENQLGVVFTSYIPAYLKKMESQQNQLAWQAEMG